MSSRIQSKPRESRFRPNNSNVNATRGPARSIAIPSNDKSSSVKENKGNNEAISGSNEDGIHNTASSPPKSTPVKTPLKQSGTPIGIPTPISIPTNTPKPLPKRTTPGPSSSSRTSVGPSLSSSSLTQSASSPGSRVRSFATPIPNQRQSESSSSNTNEITTSINIPTSLLRKTPTPSSRGVQSSSSANATASVKGNNVSTISTSSNSLGKRRMSLQGNNKRIPPRGSKPSKPASAFTLFARQRRPEVEKYAATSSGPKFDVNARVKSNWNSLSKDERIPFEKESQKLKQEYDLAMEAFKEIYGVEEKTDIDSSEGEDESISSNKKIKRSLSVSSSSIKPTTHLSGSNTAIEKSTPPAQPPNSYFLFKNDFLQRVQENGEQIPNSGTISTAWQKLKESELISYRKKAEDLRREWLTEMEEWKRNHSDDEDDSEEDDDDDDNDGNPKKKRDKNGKSKRPKNPTISDDEAEYLAEKDSQKASNQQPKKLDNRLTAMSDLSELRFTKGRASSKTFELERKLRDEKRERSKIRKKMRIHNVRTEDELMEMMGAKKKEDQRQQFDQTNSLEEQISLKRNLSEPPSDAESMINDGHTTATEGEDDAQSDVESIGAASTSTHHTLRDKKFSIRTRIVDGKIVLDESSLQQARNNDAGYNDAAEMIDINESDRFVNSSTHAKRRQRNDRWTSEETEKFLQFVSMWGSDFEMIARMFPHRNRLQIKSKWRSMERTNSHSLDLAFKRRLPVDLNEYAKITGVDLSGEVPQIELQQSHFNIKKAENEDEMDDDLVNAHLKGIDDDLPSVPPPPKKAEPELDENGLEIVEEGDDLDLSTVPSSAKLPRLTRSRVNRNKPDNSNMPPPSSTHRNLEDQSIPPPSTTTTKTRRGRSSSLASQSGANSVYSVTTTTAGGSNLLHGASSAAASDRERKQRKIREEERRQRERARRRPIPSGEEEIVDQ